MNRISVLLNLFIFANFFLWNAPQACCGGGGKKIKPLKPSRRGDLPMGRVQHPTPIETVLLKAPTEQRVERVVVLHNLNNGESIGVEENDGGISGGTKLSHRKFAASGGQTKLKWASENWHLTDGHENVQQQQQSKEKANEYNPKFEEKMANEEFGTNGHVAPFPSDQWHYLMH